MAAIASFLAASITAFGLLGGVDARPRWPCFDAVEERPWPSTTASRRSPTTSSCPCALASPASFSPFCFSVSALSMASSTCFFASSLAWSARSRPRPCPPGPSCRPACERRRPSCRSRPSTRRAPCRRRPWPRSWRPRCRRRPAVFSSPTCLSASERAFSILLGVLGALDRHVGAGLGERGVDLGAALLRAMMPTSSLEAAPATGRQRHVAPTGASMALADSSSVGTEVSIESSPIGTAASARPWPSSCVVLASTVGASPRRRCPWPRPSSRSRAPGPDRSRCRSRRCRPGRASRPSARSRPRTSCRRRPRPPCRR